MYEYTKIDHTTGMSRGYVAWSRRIKFLSMEQATPTVHPENVAWFCRMVVAWSF
jgi:hypothetical protein